MELHKENQGRFQIVELEERIAPDLTIDVLGLATIDFHLDLQLAVTTPVASIDLGLNL